MGIECIRFGNFGMYLFWRCIDISIEEFLNLARILGDQDCLTIGIKSVAGLPCLPSGGIRWQEWVASPHQQKTAGNRV